MVQEAREKLQQLDAATSAAQGWLRGLTTRQRLSAMNTFASVYPKVPQPGDKAAAAPTAPAPEERVKAANPLAILTQGLWQARPHEQVCHCRMHVTQASAQVLSEQGTRTVRQYQLPNR